MNETLKRRLVGLAVLLAALFLLSLLLPRHGALDGGEELPVTAVSLSGKPLPGPASAPTAPAIETAPVSALADEPAPVPMPKLAQHLEPETQTAAPARPPKPLPPPPKTLPKPTQLSKTLMPATDALADRPAVSKPAEARPLEPKPAPAKPAEVAKPASTPAPVSSARPVEPVAPAVVAAKPDVARPDPAAAVPAKGPRWYVQVGSFADEDRALTVCSLLSNIGFHGDASPISSQGRSLFRVRVGPYATEAEARAARDRIGGQGYPQAKVAGER